MLIQLVRLELLKSKRSLVVLLTAVCPLLVVLLTSGMYFKSTRFAAGVTPDWPSFVLGAMALWTYFMLPLYLALAAALVNSAEHKNQAWRLLFTLPVNPREVFLAKGILVWGLVLASNVFFAIYCCAAVVLMGTLAHVPTPLGGLPLAAPLARVCIAVLPILVLQHAISWRYANVAVPLGVGIFGAMGILQLGSSKYWVYFPWCYGLVSSNGTDDARRLALFLAAGIGILLLGLSSVWVGKREISH